MTKSAQSLSNSSWRQRGLALRVLAVSSRWLCLKTRMPHNPLYLAAHCSSACSLRLHDAHNLPSTSPPLAQAAALAIIWQREQEKATNPPWLQESTFTQALWANHASLSIQVRETHPVIPR